MRKFRLLAALVAGLSLHGMATAQYIDGCTGAACARANAGTFGPALFGANPSGKIFSNRKVGGCEPYCAVNSYPLSDWAYIRKFCGPQLIPGSCYGHYQTKWRKWEDHCPNGGVAGPDGVCVPEAGVPISAPYGPYNTPPMMVQPNVPAQPMAIPLAPAAPQGNTLGEPRIIETPKVDVPKVDLPTTPAKPNVPKTISATVPATMPMLSPVIKPQEVEVFSVPPQK